MYLTKKTGDTVFNLKCDGGKIIFIAENCAEPLRCYSIVGKTTVYMGLTQPCDKGFELTCYYNEKPERFLVIKGRLEEEHEVLCEFELSKPEAHDNSFFEYVFSHPSACDAVKFYGHFFVFNSEKGSVFAIPSDFEMHPMLHLLPYAFWYPVDLGLKHNGYYFIGFSGDTKPFFVEQDLLTEITEIRRTAE